MSNSITNFNNRLNISKLILARYGLVLSLSGIFFTSYIFNYKGTGIFLGISAFFLIVQFIFTENSIKNLPAPYIYLFCLLVFIVLSSLVFSFQTTDSGRIGRLGKFFVIVLSFHFINISGTDKRITQFSGIVLGCSIFWQYIACIIFNQPFGTFTNIHYLSNFAILTLPFVSYYIYSASNPYKPFYLILFSMDLHLLILSSSRPAIIGLILSTLFIVLIFSKNQIKLFSVLTLMFAFGLFYITDYGGIYSRFLDLYTNIKTEERWILWADGWQLFINNDLLKWLFGNGLGTIAQSILSQHIEDVMTFPHLSFIELLYENGITGTILVIFWFGYLIYTILRYIHTSQNKDIRFLAKSTFISLTTCLFHTGLTMHFYSKQTLYSIAFLIGIAIPIACSERNNPQSHTK